MAFNFYEGVTIERFQRVARQKGPFYYYNTDLLCQTLEHINQEIASDPHFHVHYAIKANANRSLLQFIKQAGLGVDCVSGGEVELALEEGFSPEGIVFAGVGKSDREIRLALKSGISCFNVESLPEMEVINEIAKQLNVRARIAFRVNPNVDAHTHEKITTGLNENKFGLAMEDIIPAIRLCNELEAVDYIGLHFHIGSQILDLTVYVDLCNRINEIQLQLEAEGIHTQSINVGGGLGIDYEHPDQNPIPNFKEYFKIFREHLDVRNGQQVHFELGRSIVAQCGALVTSVLYMKQGHTKNFLIVDAGFTELIRPAMYGSVHFAENITAEGARTARYDIVGPICESSDVFAKDYPLPNSQRGDVIVFRSAGAYGEVMASTYNCRNLPPTFTTKNINLILLDK